MKGKSISIADKSGGKLKAGMGVSHDSRNRSDTMTTSNTLLGPDVKNGVLSRMAEGSNSEKKANEEAKHENILSISRTEREVVTRHVR